MPASDIDKARQGLTTNELLVDLYMERALDLLRLEAGTRDKILEFLWELSGELAGLIAKVDPTGTAQAAAERRRMAKLFDLVESTIRATYRDIATVMAQEIREIVELEAAWTAEAFNTAARVDFVDFGLSKPQLDALTSDVMIDGASSKEWWGRQAAGLRDKFKDEVRKGVALGEPNGKIVDRIRGTTTQRGVMEISEASATRLVRASVQAAANTAREAMYDDNDDLISALQWSSTLDTRTSHYCIVRDGLKYTPKEHRPMGHTVPWLEGPGKLHWGCRSTSVPVLKTWRELGIDEDEVPETTRASMDGQVPAQMNFEEWLRKQSHERQDTVLGKEKAELWRADKIKFRDLLDQNGRPLTTEQLRRKARK